MGAVAGLLANAGHEVRGSDAAVYPPMSEQLAALGVPVMTPYDGGNLAWTPDLVVVGNVHGKDHVEVKAAQAANIQLTSFPAVLGDRLIEGKHAIVVTGTLTNNCCESSARDAAMRNFRTVMVSDACAAVTDADHQASLLNIFRAYGDVMTTDEAIAAIR